MRRIAYVTDIHLDEDFSMELDINPRKNWIDILEDIKYRNIPEVIFGGDIGDISAHQWFFETLKPFKFSIALGNHDGYNEVVKHFNTEVFNYQKSLYYTYDHNDYRFIFLDSSTEYINQEQFQWFKKKIITTKKIILFIHHPIFAVNALVDKKFMLKDRDKLKNELLKIENEVVIFSGHYHFEDQYREDNILQYISPASSYQVEKLSDEIKINTDTFGYRLIEIQDHQINSKPIIFDNHILNQTSKN